VLSGNAIFPESRENHPKIPIFCPHSNNPCQRLPSSRQGAHSTSETRASEKDPRDRHEPCQHIERTASSHADETATIDPNEFRALSSRRTTHRSNSSPPCPSCEEYRREGRVRLHMMNVIGGGIGPRSRRKGTMKEFRLLRVAGILKDTCAGRVCQKGPRGRRVGASRARATISE
jgi:hypothetical protein